MNKHIKTFYYVMFLLLISLSFAQEKTAPPTQQTPSPKEYKSPDKFEKVIAKYEADDKTQPQPKNAVLCYGSSSMQGWHKTLKEDLAPLTVIPRGFSGSTMNDALFFTERMVIPYKPRAILLYEGDNDIAMGIAPEIIREKFLAFVAKVHKALPETRIYFISIKPSGSRWKFWDKTKEANTLIAQECAKDKRLTFIDVASKMLKADGQINDEIFLKDKLHMNRQGYILWRDIVKEILVKNEQQYETVAPESSSAAKSPADPKQTKAPPAEK